MDDLTEAIKLFQEFFKTKPEYMSSAPGRVNIIGEHIDYNDGFVFPMAIDLKTVIVGKIVSGDTCKIVTNHKFQDQSSVVEFKTKEKYSQEKGVNQGNYPKWSMYVKGVMELSKIDFPSFHAYIYSTVPLGSGLSSSASLEVAMHAFLHSIVGKEKNELDLKEFALTCQKAEHLYAKVPCGIMDQFIATMAEANYILLLDCVSQTTEQVQFTFPDYKFVVFNSNVKHELAGGEYAKRRAQCDEAKKILGLSNWRDATLDSLKSSESKMSPETVKRVRHVITEIARVKQAVKCLNEFDIKSFGEHMTASHRSLQHDYDVSCKELDELVELSLQVEGVMGARMTGGGFGGCMVVLVKVTSLDALINHISSKFSKAPSKYYISEPRYGVEWMKIPASKF